MKSAFKFQNIIEVFKVNTFAAIRSCQPGVIWLRRSFPWLWGFKESSLRPVSGVLVILLWSAISPRTTVNRSTDSELSERQKTAHLLWLCLCAKATVTVIKPVSVRGGSGDYCCQCSVFNRQLRWNEDLSGLPTIHFVATLQSICQR